MAFSFHEKYEALQQQAQLNLIKIINFAHRESMHMEVET